MANQTTHDNIDRYLRNEMNSAERNDFETELAQNEELSADLAFLQDTQTALALQHQEALKKKLQSFEEEDTKVISLPFWNRNTFRYGMAAAVLLVVAGLWFISIPYTEKNVAINVGGRNAGQEKNRYDDNSNLIIPEEKTSKSDNHSNDKELTNIPNDRLNSSPSKTYERIPIEIIGSESLGMAGLEKEFLDFSIQLSPKDTLQYTWQGDKLTLQHYQKIATPSIKKVTSSSFSGTYLKIEDKYYRISQTVKPQKLLLEESKKKLKILQ